MKVTPAKGPEMLGRGHGLTSSLTGTDITSKDAPVYSPPTGERKMSAVERARAKARGLSLTPPTSTPKVEEIKKDEEIHTLDTSSVESIGQNDISEGVEPSDAVELDSPSETPAVTEAPKEELLSTQYAILARKEKALRAKAQAQMAAEKAREDEFRRREEAFKAQEAEYKSKYISKDRFQEDALGALSEIGLSYDALTQQALSSPDPQYRALQDEIKSLRAAQEQQLKALEDYRKSQEDMQRQSYEQGKMQVRAEVQSLVETSPDFETIKATDRIDDVVELIEKSIRSGGMMSAEEAARAVEEHLAEEEYQKYVRLSKLRARFETQNKPKETPPQQSVDNKQSAPAIKTLTNASSSARKLSAIERAKLKALGQG